MSTALLYLLAVTVVTVLGRIAVEHIRARTTRYGFLAEIVREIIRWWRR
ncbi:MAG: hypothetical protein ACRDRH_05625 [Pseudonocardia sp.]